MPFDNSKPYTLDRIVRIAITIGIGYGLIVLMNYLSSVLVPFVLSMLIAYLLFPLVKFLENRIFKNRIAATLIGLILVLIVVTGLFLVTIPIIGSQVQKMGELLSNLVNKNTGQNLPEYLQSLEQYIIEFARREDVQELFNVQNIEAALEKLLPGLFGSLSGIVSGSLSIVIGFVGLTIIAFYIIFILIDFEEIMGGWSSFIPAGYRNLVVTLLDDLKEGMETYFRAQSIIVFIVCVLFAIGFTVIGLPLGFLLGIFIGLLNYVPYLQNVGFIPATFLAAMHSLETGDSFWSMMGLVLLVFAIVQTIQDAILTPKIMGDATGLNPAMILLSLTVWGKIMGMLGLLIALPITSILVSYYRRFLKAAEREHSNIILDPSIYGEEASSIAKDDTENNTKNDKNADNQPKDGDDKAPDIVTDANDAK